MWADTLLREEQLHLLRVMAWGALTVVVGTALLALQFLPRARAAIPRELGAVLAAIGAIELVVAAALYRGARLVDVSGALRLERLAWLALGLFIGCIATGAALAAAGWLAGRSRRVTAAGVGLAVHGAALVILTLLFIPAVSR